MVVLALMHSLHRSALFSLVYIPHSAVAAGRGIPDACLTFPSSENEKEVGACVCVGMRVWCVCSV